MIDPFNALSMSVYHLPGVYALLLGSGVSRPAEIPTGGELTELLIHEIACTTGAEVGATPRDWYSTKYNEEPSYSSVLENVARTPDERSGILRSYFELTDEEKVEESEQRKRPTKAHKRIAKLVEGGYIKVILTTNFDTLMEQALDSLHASYQVISSAADIPNALPLVHSKCTIIKLHGDYKNANIRNTVEELSSYDPPMQGLLDQVLSEYGLVVCGWSAESDVALAETFLRCTSMRYSTYWTVRKEPRPSVAPLIKQRKAHMIDIAYADSFFTQLEEKVDALKRLDRTGAPTAEMASATVKRYLRSSDYRIDLNDFVMKQVDQLQQEVSFANLVSGLASNTEELDRLVRYYEEKTKIIQAIMITGSRWGQPEHNGIWIECLYRVASTNIFQDGTPLSHVKLYPALLLLYSGGIAAIAAGKNDVRLGKYELLEAFLTRLKLKTSLGVGSRPFISIVRPRYVFESPMDVHLLKGIRHKAGASQYLYQQLRGPLEEILPLEDDYRECFDRFEYLSDLVRSELFFKERGHYTGTEGIYAIREEIPWEEGIVNKLDLEMMQMEEVLWPPFAAGLFGSHMGIFSRVKTGLLQADK